VQAAAERDRRKDLQVAVRRQRVWPLRLEDRRAPSTPTRRTRRSSARPSVADAAFPGTHGGKTFAEFYGSGQAGKQGSNAFGKCVSSKAKALDQQQQQATITAAKTCKAERTKLGPTEFTKNYGGHSNAFGKCVSKTAHANP
jgi:hypothetical protein